ncbi:MAG: DMT family transporter, partial [bacterium]|nr:DMT family transporter [bacterium]
MNASPTPATSPPRAVALPAITACLFWATAFAAIKGALQYTDSAVTLAGLRFFVAGCILVPFNGHPRNYVAFLREHWRTVFLVSLFQTVILYGLMFWGMTMVRGAQAAIVMGAIPLISAVFAHVTMRNDRMTLRKIAFIMLGMTGVSIIGLSSKPWGEAGPTECIGLAVLLLSQCS